MLNKLQELFPIHYRKGNVLLINADCMEVMKHVNQGYFELACVDPPYGIDAGNQSDKSKNVVQKNGSKIYLKDNGYEKKDWDKKTPSKEYFEELFRVSKHQIIFGINYYPFLNVGCGRIIWDKLNDHSDQNDCEIAYCSINTRVDIVRYLWSGFMQGLLPAKDSMTAIVQQGNKKLNEARIHPTQKPRKLYDWLLANYCDKEMKVFDTHLGSGSSAIAAHYYGVEFVGCELDKEYYENAVKRFELQTAQETLF